jgi:hypothetical protein
MEPSREVMATDEVPQAISCEEIRLEQAVDDECDARMSRVKNGIIDVDEDGILVRIGPLDGSRQIVVPWSLRPRPLWLEHFPVVAAHPGCRKCMPQCAAGLLEEHAQGSRRNRPTLHRVREEPSDRKEEDQFPQVVPRKRAPRVCRHVHIGPAAKNGTRKPLTVGNL